jgi:hypothetical protein
MRGGGFDGILESMVRMVVLVTLTNLKLGFYKIDRLWILSLVSLGNSMICKVSHCL